MYVKNHDELVAALFDVKQMLTIIMKYKVLAIYLQGSQNYMLDTETSDIDMNAFVLPSPEDLYYGRTVSKTYQTRFGQVEVKDFRLFVELVKKANPSYLELLNTRYSIVDKRLESIANNKLLDEIVKDRYLVFLQAIKGTINQKYNGVFKASEGTQCTLDEYGYQPKELHHLARLVVLCRDVVRDGKKLSESYIPDVNDRDYLVGIKTGKVFEKDISAVTLAADSLKAEADLIINQALLESKPIVDTSIYKFSERMYDIFMEEIKKYL